MNSAPPESVELTVKIIRSTAALQLPTMDLSGYDERDSLVVRTDFSDERAWRRVVAAVSRDVQAGFSGHFINDPAWDGASAANVMAALPPGQPVVFFIADSVTMRHGLALLVTRPATAAAEGQARAVS